jgi:uncharacterized protein YodC (DUF2158 family)
VRVPAVPVTTPLDPDDRRRMLSLYEARLIVQDSERPGYAETFAELTTFLLSLGGQLVVPPIYTDGMVRRLLVDGLCFADMPLTVEAGEPNDCHGNVVRLWRGGRAMIASGYALSEDGLWREHSWGVRDGTVVETTEPRQCYWGVLINDDDAGDYASWVEA